MDCIGSDRMRIKDFRFTRKLARIYDRTSRPVFLTSGGVVVAAERGKKMEVSKNEVPTSNSQLVFLYSHVGCGGVVVFL